jgi:hypothetical protein
MRSLIDAELGDGFTAVLRGSPPQPGIEPRAAVIP